MEQTIPKSEKRNHVNRLNRLANLHQQIRVVMLGLDYESKIEYEDLERKVLIEIEKEKNVIRELSA